MSPSTQLSIITKAMGGTPVVQWALGVAAVVAAVSLALTFVKSPLAAGIGFLVMVFFMVLLRIVALAAHDSSGNMLKGPALLVIWTVALSFCGICVLIFSSVVLQKPQPWPVLVATIFGNGPLPPVKTEKESLTPVIVNLPQSNEKVREIVVGSGKEITPDQLPLSVAH